jgi:hypothetical protein
VVVVGTGSSPGRYLFQGLRWMVSGNVAGIWGYEVAYLAGIPP